MKTTNTTNTTAVKKEARLPLTTALPRNKNREV
jgi:hypothetical protein